MIWFICAVATIVILLFILICPALRKHPESELCKNMYVAHRGLHTDNEIIPENSLPAFKKAKEHKFAIELDIHITKDGKVAVFHDDTLKRMCGIDNRIEEMTSEQLKKCRLLKSNEQIPMLEDVLALVDGKVCLVIEYKCELNNYKTLCSAADRLLKNYKGKYIVQSFNPLAMMWYRKHRPDICRGQLSTNFIREPENSFLRTVVGFLLLNIISKPDFISYGIKYTNVFQRRLCTSLGAISAGWTFKSQKQLDKYRDNYDIYIFEGFIPKRP